MVLMTIRGSLQRLEENSRTLKSFSSEEMENVSVGEIYILCWVFLVAKQQIDSGKYNYFPRI